MIIRPLNEKDIPALVEIWNLLNPDWPRSVIEQLDSYRKHDPKYHYQAWVAEEHGQVIGTGHSEHSIASFHPRKFLVEFYVNPSHQGQGVGKQLYEQVLETLQPYDPIGLSVQVREDSTRALTFFTERGFAETKRDWISTLDIAKVDITAYEQLESELNNQGITIKSLAEIEDPDKYQKFHTLFSEARLDVPRSDPATPISFEFFMENNIQGPEFDPKLFWVALDKQNYIGFTGLYLITDTTKLDQWLTAVKRDYRGKHVALALKVRSIQVAKEQGYTHIRTDNDSRNAPMIAINDKLGFERGMASLSLAKVLKADS